MNVVVVVVIVIVVVAIIAGAVWWNSRGGSSGSGGSGGSQTAPGPNDVGQCQTMDGKFDNVTLEDCANMGGTSFKPNDATKQTVNPQTGQPL